MSIRKHIDLIEGFEDEDRDPAYDRERKIEALLHVAVQKVGLELAEVAYNVSYMDDERTAYLKVYERVGLKQLQALSIFGDVSVHADPGNQDVLVIEIIVHEQFDENASIV